MITRRTFMPISLSGVLGATLARAAEEKQEPALSFRTLTEPARDLPIKERVDVIVCGAGPAGVAAALAAARSGASVRLLESCGCLGGTWTAGLLSWIFDFKPTGLTKEIADALDQRQARIASVPDKFTYEPEEMKILLEELCQKAGIKIRLNTRVVAAYKTGRRISTVITESKSGREAWQASLFIDATGDGDLGAQAGCMWDFGFNARTVWQPATLNALAIVNNIEALKPHISGGTLKTHLASTERNKAAMLQAGIKPSYGHPTIFHIHGNVVLLMFNHEYSACPFDCDQMTAATLRARREVHTIARALNALGGCWEGLRIIASAEQIGIREGRRIHGLYTVTKEDLLNGTHHADAVARVFFPVDIHAHSKAENDKQALHRGGVEKFKPYDIPVRALISKDVDNLLMAGRCISGDFVAHGSYRVTGNAVAMGEAAGKVAAYAAAHAQLPRDVNYPF